MRKVAVSAVMVFVLTACSDMTPAQKRAAALTIAGCVIDQAGAVVPVAVGSDPAAAKAVAAAMQARAVATTDPACAAAVAALK